MKNLANKIAVITGAGSGIGRELALQLSSKGAVVALTDFNAKTLQKTYQDILDKGGRASQYVFDVANREAVYGFAEEVLDEYGHVDIVINNAGVALGRLTVNEVSYKDFEWIVGINMWGPIYGTKAFLPTLLKRPEASIVNISSLFGIIGMGTQAPYCTTKFALRGFNESLRMELIDTNVVISSVHPGGIRTNIARNSRPVSESEKAKMVKRFDKLAKTTAESAAAQIIRGIQAKNTRILVGNDAKIMDVIARIFPRLYTRFISSRVKKMEKRQ